MAEIKDSCDLNALSSLKIADFKFKETPKFIGNFDADKETDYGREKLETFEVAAVTNGVCQDAKMYVINFHWVGPCKGGCDSNTDNILSEYLTDEISTCSTPTSVACSNPNVLRIIKYKNLAVSDFNVSLFLKDFKKSLNLDDKISFREKDFRPFLFPLSEFKWKDKTIKIQKWPKHDESHFEACKNLPKEGLTVYSEKSLGLIKVKDRTATLYAKDCTQTEINIGLAKEVEGYSFTSVLDSDKTRMLKKEDFQKIDRIYMLKDKNHKYLKVAYNSYKDYVEKYNYRFKDNESRKDLLIQIKDFDAYIYEKPIIAKEDPLGRLHLYRKIEATVPLMAEPLMYFYTDTKENIQIGFDESIQLEVTIPKVKNRSWSFESRPPHSYINKEDGRLYQTAFWEGRSFITPEWTHGWSVSRKTIETFITEKLKQLGLIDREVTDFLRYWKPRLNSFPYYKVRFFTEPFLRYYSPLTITPNPESFIRVHMEALGTSKPIKLKPQIIPENPPTRGKFTVVEWSGFLY